MTAWERQAVDEVATAQHDPADEPREVDQVRLYQTCIKSNFDMIRLADQKSQAMLRVAMTLFGAAFLGVPPSVVALKKFTTGGGWGMMVLFLVVVALYIAFSCCLLTAIMKLVHVVRPRSVPPPARTSAFLFASIARMEVDGLRNAMRDMSYDQTVDELLLHIHQSSQIAEKKFKALEQAVAWMFGGGLIGVAFALILLVSVGWFQG